MLNQRKGNTVKRFSLLMGNPPTLYLPPPKSLTANDLIVPPFAPKGNPDRMPQGFLSYLCFSPKLCMFCIQTQHKDPYPAQQLVTPHVTPFMSKGTICCSFNGDQNKDLDSRPFPHQLPKVEPDFAGRFPWLGRIHFGIYTALKVQ